MGSLNDAMLVFLNQDAYDKYCLSKEDYELRKELEKEQKKSAGKDTPQDKNKDKKKKDDKKDSNTDEKDDQPKDIVVELRGIEDRVVRLTPNSSDMGSTIISKDGETLYYLAAFEGGYDLWKMNLRKKETRLLHKMDAGWQTCSWTRTARASSCWVATRCRNGHFIRRADPQSPSR